METRQFTVPHPALDVVYRTNGRPSMAIRARLFIEDRIVSYKPLSSFLNTEAKGDLELLGFEYRMYSASYPTTGGIEYVL